MVWVLFKKKEIDYQNANFLQNINKKLEEIALNGE
jgi:hypothetical protein